MMSRMATVRAPKAEKMIERPKKPPLLREDKPRCITIDQSTSDSSANTNTVKTVTFTTKRLQNPHCQNVNVYMFNYGL